MEILYESKKIEAIFTTPSKLSSKVDGTLLKLIKKRMLELKATDHLETYLKMGLGRPHPLTANLHGTYAVRLDANKRLIFKPIYDSADKSPKLCTKIMIKGVVDYHGRKPTVYIP